MVQFRHAQREIQFKIVYYGPALGGKTTNLEALHEIADPEGNTQLVSLKTAEDRTLFFDFLPFNLGEIQGYQIRYQVYTVPGQVHYNTTRKVVLAGTDAIIFVADSQARPGPGELHLLGEHAGQPPGQQDGPRPDHGDHPVQQAGPARGS